MFTEVDSGASPLPPLPLLPPLSTQLPHPRSSTPAVARAGSGHPGAVAIVTPSARGEAQTDRTTRLEPLERPGAPEGWRAPGSTGAPNSIAEADRLLDQLPDGRWELPDAAIVARLLRARRHAEAAVVYRLRSGPAAAVPERGHRAAWLVSLAGEWRSERAIPVLLDHLDAPQSYGDDELIQAFTRIGPRALTPLLLALFDRRQSTRVRRRAARAVTSIGVAACDYGDDLAWPGDPDGQYREIVASLRLLVSRSGDEAPELVAAAAMGLADLRCQAARSEIASLFARHAVPEDGNCNLQLAIARLDGRQPDLALGTWRLSMLSWLAE